VWVASLFLFHVTSHTLPYSRGFPLTGCVRCSLKEGRATYYHPHLPLFLCVLSYNSPVFLTFLASERILYSKCEMYL
jgi:hypothetical protein